MAALTYSTSAGGWVAQGTSGPTVTPTTSDDLTVPSGTNVEISANLEFHTLTIGTTYITAGSVIVDEGVTLTGDVIVIPGSNLQLGNNTSSPNPNNPAVVAGSLVVRDVDQDLTDGAAVFNGLIPSYGATVRVYSGSFNGTVTGDAGSVRVLGSATSSSSNQDNLVFDGSMGGTLILSGARTGLDAVIREAEEAGFDVPGEGGEVNVSAVIDNTSSTINLVQPGNAIFNARLSGSITGGTLISGATSVVNFYSLTNVSVLGTLNIPAGNINFVSGTFGGPANVNVAGKLFFDTSTTDSITINVTGVLDGSSGFGAVNVTFGTGTVINVEQGATITFDHRFNNSVVLQGNLNVAAAAAPYTTSLSNPAGTVQFASGSGVTVGALATFDVNSTLDNKTTVQLAGGEIEIDELPSNLGVIQFFDPSSTLQIGNASSSLFGVTGTLLDFSNTDTVLFAGIAYGAAANFTLTDNSLQVFDQNGSSDATFTLTRDDSQTYSKTSFVLGSTSAGMTLTTTGIAPLVAPTVSAGGTASFTGGGAPVLLDPGITLTDPGSTTLIGATISIGTDIAGDTLNFSDQNGISGLFDSMTGVLSLTGKTSLANYQTALQSITYSFPLNSDPTAGGGLISRTISWAVNDGDVASLAATSTLNVADALPVVTAGATASYSTGGVPAVADTTITVTDANSLTLAGARVAITGGTFTNDGDLLNADTTGTAITTFYNPLNETLFLSGTDTIADYQKVLSRVTFVEVTADPTNGGADPSRTLTWMVNNGVTGSTPVTSTINVLPGRSMIWTGANSADFADTLNWNDATDGINPAASAPGSADVATFTSGSGSISGTGAANWLFFGGSTQWTVSSGTNLSAPSGVVVATNGGTGGLLIHGSIVSGAVATGVPAQGFDVAPAVDGTGDVAVAGAGALLANTGNFIIGEFGAATLTVSSGATVTTAGNADIGLNAGSSGNVDIEGVGSQLDVTGVLDISDAGTGVLTLGANTELTVTNAINVGSHGTLTQVDSTIDPASLTISQGGSAGGSGSDTYTVETLNSGTLLANGTLTVTTPLITLLTSGHDGVLEVQSGSNLILNTGSVDSSQVVFFDDGTGVLTIGTLAGFAATIGGFTVGDTIIVDGVPVASQSFDPGTHVLTLFNASDVEAGTLQFGGSVESVAGLTVTGTAPCFVAGTRIATEHGEIAIEGLRVGDRVQVLDGSSQPVIWLGHRTVDCARHPQPRKVWPVRVAAGAFGPDQPRRDLLLSPDHALLVDGVLIPVKYLLNGVTIAQVPVLEVTYHHVELARHAILLAEGLPAESYLDTGDRTGFANGGRASELYPDLSSVAREAQACAPLTVAGAALDAARCRVNMLAQLLPP
jgi:collagen type I alpha